ncbi:MAG: hypothetical protein U0Q16_00340 [Bryobacteraceae bacterium]
MVRRSSWSLSIGRTLRSWDRVSLDMRIDANNSTNTPVFPSWNAVAGHAQFGLPDRVNAMRWMQSDREDGVLTMLRTLLAFAMLLPAQVGRNRSADSPTPTFQSTTQLVVETVPVKDKDGKPITGLEAKDFVLTEDGVPQQIKVFEYQKLDTALPAAALPNVSCDATFTLIADAGGAGAAR